VSERLTASVRWVGEPVDKLKRAWRIIIQTAGKWLKLGPNKHPLYSPPELLSTMAGIFDRTKIFLNHQTPDESEAQPERDEGAAIGVVSDVQWDPAEGELGALVGVANLTDEETIERIRNAHDLGVMDAVGSFSITAFGDVEEQDIDGTTYDVITAFDPEAPVSVDYVTEPAAGGRFLTRLAASLRAHREGHAMSWTELLKAKPAIAQALLAAEDYEALLASLELSDLAEDFLTELNAARAELQAAAEPAPEPEPAPDPEPVADDTEDKVAAAVARTEAAERRLSAAVAKLEAKAETAEIDEMVSPFDEAQRPTVRAALTAVKDPKAREQILGSFKALAAPKADSLGFPTGTRGDVQMGADEQDKFEAGLEGMFYREWGPRRRTDVEIEGHGKVPYFHSIREAMAHWPAYKGATWMGPQAMMAAMGSPYKRALGFDPSTGRGSQQYSQVMRAGKWVRLEASVTRSDFAEVYGDVKTKVMLKLWHSSNLVSELLPWASMIDDLTDFNDKNYIQLGEYADLSTVAEGTTYPTLDSPGDLQEKEGLTKYGGQDSITFEALTDDDGSQLAAMPRRMVMAALRTVRKAILDEVFPDDAGVGPTLNSDSTALYDAGAHANTGTQALHIGGLDVTEKAMVQQTAADSLEPIGYGVLRIWGICVPPELVSLAMRISSSPENFRMALTAPGGSAEIDNDRFKGIRVISADHHTNATDWYAMADPAKIDTFVVQFLRGVREPEFFQLTEGDTNFSADIVRWKVRIFLGVEPLQYRSFYQQNVA
jgi:hypothetical protein